MKNFFANAAIAVLAAGFVWGAFLYSSIVSAAPVYKATLTSSDAGSTQTVTIAAGVDYVLQCTNPACFKTASSGSNLSVSCATGYNCDRREDGTGTMELLLFGGGDAGQSITVTHVVPKVHTCAFESAADVRLVAIAADAGDPDCRLFQDTRNARSIR